METKLIKITRDLTQGRITKKVARSLLLDLMFVDKDELDKHNLIIKEHGYGLYQLRQNGVFIIESDEIGCHEKARDIINK